MRGWYKSMLIVFSFFLFVGEGWAQTGIKWWNPQNASFPVVEGQGWHDGLAHFYDRLPARAEKSVRKAVWDLSRNAAGLKIRFKTKSKEIYVRYTVEEGLNMPHFPSTGRSGVDLYAMDENGAWQWSGSKYSFGDTIQYHFSSLPDDYERVYHLYLPLYNTIKWLEIGVPDSSVLTPQPLSSDKPIVVYGTSIAQGGVASRAGMAWTAILQRKLDRPLINLAFSGNGRLESSVTNFLGELDPALYVIDCLPNMGSFTNDTIAARLIHTVSFLKKARPGAPVLIAADALAAIHSLNTGQVKEFDRMNQAADSAFRVMVLSGIKNIYFLPASAIGLSINSTVEGVHPSDEGMEQYAQAYEHIIRDILHEPEGGLSTMKPVRQYRDRKFYWWDERHEKELALMRKHPPEVVFIGNSITHYWSGEPSAPIHRGDDSWNRFFKPLNIQNLGYGWDRVENVLWRVYHGELDGYKARQILINIGTNNIGLNTDEEIISGLKLLIRQVRQRQPQAKILMVGIYPRRNLSPRVAMLNHKILQLSSMENIDFADPGIGLLDATGNIDESLFVDGLHPNAKGYDIIAKNLSPYLVKPR